MDSRERILSVLRGEQTDRVPFDIWYTDEVRDQLLAYCKVSDEQELWRFLNIDKIVMLDAPYSTMASWELDASGRAIMKKEWGNVVAPVKNSSGGTYEETIGYPLVHAQSVQEVNDHRWPEMSRFQFDELRGKCLKYQRWIRMLTFISLFEIYCKLRPMDMALMDLYSEQDLAKGIISRIHRVQRRYMEEACRVCDGLIDIVYLSDDMGMQDRQLISVEVWEDMFAGPYKDLIDLAHEQGAYVFYHSDGAAFPIIQRMVDLGVDIINPIQHTCPGMEREHLIAAFGEQVVFHGAVENQHILPFGTPKQVVDEARADIQVLGSRGRYICAPCHNLQPGTPLENILELYRMDRSW